MKQLIALLILSTALNNVHATSYFFSSSSGDDSRTSTQAQSSSTPWRSLSKLNSIFSSLKPGDYVYFNRGDIFYGSIAVNQSGYSSAPITFLAYGTGNRPIIAGLSDVSGWTSVGTNLWTSAAISAGQSTAMIVLINGSYYPMGRYPNANTTNGGYLTYESSGTNYITDNQLTTSTNWTGAQVVVRKSTWIIDKGTITSHSGGTLTYTPTASGTNYGVNGAGYFIQNDIRTLDQQGEWYYNPSTKKLTVYWPSTPPATQISTSTTVLDGGSRSYIKFDNITFKGSIGRMINIPGTTGFTFTSCDFLDAGEDAMWCCTATNLDIENCTFTNTNNNGIIGTGLSGFTLKNTSINNTGIYPGMSNQRSYYSCEGIHVSGNNITIQNNSITNTGFTVINFQGNNVTLRNNYIDSYCSVKGDGAAIYTWIGSSGIVYTNRVIDGNICVNAIEAVNGSANPSNDVLLDAGIYIDDYSQYVTVTNNSIANCPKGIYLHNVSNITVRGNTVYNNTYGGIIPRYTGGNLLRNITCIGNKVVEKSSTVACYRYKSTTLDITSIGTSDSNYYARPMADNTTMLTEVPGSTWYTLSTFQTAFIPREKNSKKSPKSITSSSSLIFEYNNTTSSKTISLGSNYIDVKGVTYAGSITLAPYTSAVLILASGGTTQAVHNTTEVNTATSVLPGNSFTIYPNPARESTTLEISNIYTGKMNVQIINQAGAVLRSETLNKDQQLNRVSLSTDNLPVGAYFILVQIGSWSDKRKLIKL